MVIRKNAEAHLSDTQLERLANLLAEKHRELAHKVDSLNQLVTMKEDCSITDTAEAAGLLEETPRASSLAYQHLKTMIEINHARLRLENGHYGISEISGEPIPYKRLLLIPWARRRSNE